MRANLHFHSVWANTSRAIRQCQMADRVLQDGLAESATDHYRKALEFFAAARKGLARAEDRANQKLGDLLQAGNDQLELALSEYAAGYPHSARAHYDNAFKKYDEALDLIE